MAATHPPGWFSGGCCHLSAVTGLLVAMRPPPAIKVRNVNDTQLLELCRTGDHNAYGQIVERYQTLVCSIAYSGCGDFSLSQDLAQETFIAAWRKLADLRDPSKLRSWICTIARNLAHRSARKESRSATSRSAPLEAGHDVASAQPSPGEQAINDEEATLVWQSLEQLPENYREPLILFYREEQSIARVATALELSEDAVKQRLSRGRKMVHGQLAELVGSTLTRSRPSRVFTLAVVAALPALDSSAAVAGGVAAKTAGLTALGHGALHFLTSLPIIVWCVKLSVGNARSERERRYVIRQLLLGFGLLFLSLAVMFTILWGHLARGGLVPAMLPALVMFGMLLPIFFFSYRAGRRIEQIRMEDGTHEKPISVTGPGGVSVLGIHGRFMGSALLVILWPCALSLMAADWVGLATFAAIALASSLIGVRACLRFPKKYFQIFTASLASMSLGAQGVMWLKRGAWEAAFPGGRNAFLIQMIWVYKGMGVTLLVLSILVWKRVYSRRAGKGKLE
jgi:RNA polymerase sigma factor (sigma-70 family)